MVKNDVINKGLSDLEKNMEILDVNFKDVDTIVTQISFNQNMRNFYNVTRPLSDNDYDKLRKMLEMMTTYRKTKSFIRDIIIYLPMSDVFVSTSFATASSELLYKNVKYSSLSFKKWYNRLSKKYQFGEYWPAENITIANEQFPAITYVKSIPLGDFNNYKGIIMVFINEQEIHNIMMTLNSNVNGWYYIKDVSGKIITSSGQYIDDNSLKSESGYKQGIYEQTTDGKRMTLIRTTSGYNGWTYTVAYPTRSFMEKVDYVKNIYIVSTFIIVIIGTLIALYLAYKNSLPLKMIINKINSKLGNEELDDMNEYDSIERIYEKLITNNERLKEDMKRQTVLLKSAFFERLYRNRFQSVQELDVILNHIGIKIFGQGFFVILISIEGYNGKLSEDILNELSMLKVVVNNTLKETLGTDLFIHDTDHNRIAVLIALESLNEAECKHYAKNIINNILNHLYSDLKERLAFGIGRIYRNLMDIGMSFNEAGIALENRTYDDEMNIIWYEHLPKSKAEYYYPLDIQIRLLNLVKTGEQCEIISVIKNIHYNNFVKNNLSHEMMSQLIYEMRGTLFKIMDHLFSAKEETVIEIKSRIYKLNEYESTDDVFACVTEIYNFMCNCINKQKQSYDVQLKEKILEYVSINYNKEDLCLYTVASKFGFAEKYFSQLFKELTGENFSTYLERIRIIHAVQLLSEENTPIKEIAKNVGYNNVNTFYKAFKRINITSPRDYKRGKIIET